MTQLSVQNRKSLLLISVSCFALALMVLAFGAFGPATFNSSTPAVPYLMIMLLLLLGLVVGRTWLNAFAPGTLTWLHPPLMITVWILFFFSLPGLYPLLRPEVLAPPEQQMIEPVYIIGGMWLIVVGCVALWFGYGVGYRVWKPLRFVQRLSQRQPRLAPVLVLFGITVALQLVQISVVGIAYGADSSQWGVLVPLQQALGYLRDADRLVLALVALKTFRREWPFWSLIVVVIPQIAFGFISGFMKPILWITLILLVTSFVAGVRLRRLAAPAVFLAILGVLIVPVAEDLRSQQDTGWLDTNSATEVVDATAQSLRNAWSAGASASWQLALDRTLYRNAGVAFTPGIIMQKTPSLIPYQGIEQFLAVPAYIIPRAIWPDKPVLSRGIWFSIVYLNQPDFSTSSAAITIFGEGYMFAGWFGAILACLAIGLLLAFAYQNTVAAGLLPIFLALLPTFLDVEGQFTSMFVGVVQQLAVYFCVYWLMGLSLADGPEIRLIDELGATSEDRVPSQIAQTSCGKV